jgi:acetyl-CoA carboxylase/biotin carboxylase 1
VIDPTINPEQMEMYADEESRGGVLEPEGIVNIKYRRDKQLDTMARLDPAYAELRRALNDKALSQKKHAEIKAKMAEREQQLLPVYLQIALQFADLHDRAGRMEAKGTIRASLRWKESRRYFYWRLRRRLSEELILKRIASAAPSLSPRYGPGAPNPTTTSSATPAPPTSSSPYSTPTSARDTHLQILRSWINLLDTEFERNDRRVALWYEENKKMIFAKIEVLKAESVAVEVAQLLMGNKDGGLKGVQQVLSMLPVEEREAVLKYLGSS